MKHETCIEIRNPGGRSLTMLGHVALSGMLRR